MADKLTLVAEHRTEFGKGFARRIRATDKIPAVLYGHGTAPDHIVLPGHETMMALKNPNALLSIDIDGKKTLSIAKDVQRDPIKRTIVHVDLLIVKKGEKITVDVPVHLEGESAPGTIHVLEINSLEILAEATHLPEYITVSIDGMEEGDKLLAGDITLPQGSELEGDPEQLIVHISVPRTAAEEEADEAAAAGGDDEGSSDESASEDDEN
ncbi:50S ribosomal protein L25/general stress protein Ctc [Demequina muriae]|uniref:Large ribosomal subunit protein bL25 n=1 Tax=Demequina muriae TaxID=3051664 RepID=A0ABT8GF66_9MICO|nr:50S ribosomal protein L25/general stress protein Ctc [Demequina sp. EGI L300058]MDN4480070.1 50S ribosomal protein L25/general stress protein Ctc [Demequina sp. EGI L300058]